MGPQFFETRMGHDFYEGTMRAIAGNLKKVAAELKRANDLKEIELGIKTEGDETQDE